MEQDGKIRVGVVMLNYAKRQTPIEIVELTHNPYIKK